MSFVPPLILITIYLLVMALVLLMLFLIQVDKIEWMEAIMPGSSVSVFSFFFFCQGALLVLCRHVIGTVLTIIHPVLGFAGSETSPGHLHLQMEQLHNSVLSGYGGVILMFSPFFVCFCFIFLGMCSLASGLSCEHLDARVDRRSRYIRAREDLC